MQDFQKIQAWQRAHALAIVLHKETRRWARGDRVHIRAQLVRAADSVAANIVEGCGASTPREFARFLDIAIKSASETEYHLLTSRDLGLMLDERWQSRSTEIVEIRKMLHAYRKKVLASAR